MEILIGTANPSKLALYQEHLALPGVILRTPAELGITCDCPEDAHTPEGNAIQKAAAWHRASGLPVFSLDSGLLFLDLPEDHPDQPGTHVRRVNGKTLNDDEMLVHYIALMKKHGGSLRASWQNAACLYFDENHVFTYVKNREMLEGTVIRLVRNSRTELGCDEGLFKTVVKTGFNQRRKTLRNSLKPLIRAKADREGWSDEQLAEFVADPIYDLRPERLSVEDFINLTLKLA